VKKAKSHTGKVHYVSNIWGDGQIDPLCNHRTWIGDYWGKQWELTDEDVTCLNCIKVATRMGVHTQMVDTKPTKKKRLTIGCRARIFTIKEIPKRTGPGYAGNEDSWRKEFGGREVLLQKRSASSGFSVMLIGEGVTELKKEVPKTIGNQMAWISEEDMELINRDFDTNLDFMDWYEENEENFCPDCGAWFPDRGRADAKTNKDFECPSCGYSE